MGRLASILILLAYTMCIQAQGLEDSAKNTSHALTVGIGTSDVLDTYLSPISYKGISARIMRETFRQTHLADGRIYVQSLVSLQASETKNSSGNGKMYTGLATWNMSWLYRMENMGKLRLFLGGGSGLDAGVIYNRRNSNNPANAKFSAALQATAVGLYDIRLAGRDMLLKGQVSMPVLGLMFSPEFGQSYYGMFMVGHHGHNIVVTSPLSRPSVLLNLSLDIPLGNDNVRIGYVGDIYQTKANDISSHIWSHSIMVGYERTLTLERDRKRSPLRK